MKHSSCWVHCRDLTSRQAQYKPRNIVEEAGLGITVSDSNVKTNGARWSSCKQRGVTFKSQRGVDISECQSTYRGRQSLFGLPSNTEAPQTELCTFVVLAAINFCSKCPQMNGTAAGLPCLGNGPAALHPALHA